MDLVPVGSIPPCDLHSVVPQFRTSLTGRPGAVLDDDLQDPEGVLVVFLDGAAREHRVLHRAVMVRPC